MIRDPGARATSRTPASLPEAHYPALDGLRALAILLVLFHHFGANRLLKGSGIFIDSRTGVHLFFVLSGFLITTILLRERQEQQGRIPVRNFYRRRGLRILPVVYLFLAVLALLNYAFQLHIQPVSFVTSFFFLNNLPIGPAQPYTAHLWTLAVEVQFYLVFPWLLLLGTNRYLWLTAAVLLLVPLTAMLGFYHALPDGRVLVLAGKACAYFFWKGPLMILTGSFFALLAFKGIIGTSKGHAGTSLILLVVALVICDRSFVWYEKYVCEFLAALLMGYSIVRICVNRDVLGRLLAQPLLRRIGRLSYSLYIWQELFVGLNLWQPWLTRLQSWPLWAVVLFKFAASFAIAALSYSLFESRFLRLKQRFSRTNAGRPEQRPAGQGSGPA